MAGAKCFNKDHKGVVIKGDPFLLLNLKMPFQCFQLSNTTVATMKSDNKMHNAVNQSMQRYPTICLIDGSVLLPDSILCQDCGLDQCVYRDGRAHFKGGEGLVYKRKK